MTLQLSRSTSNETDAEDAVSDAEWARIADGCRRLEHASFERLVELTQSHLRRIAGRLASGPGIDLDELMQETYLRAWRAIGRFRGQSSLLTWLTRIAVNVALSARRDRRPTVPFEPQRHERSAATEIGEAGMLEAYERALEQLDPDIRSTFVLHETEGMSYRQVAAVLECPIGTVMSRLHRAREQLVAELRDRLEELIP